HYAFDTGGGGGTVRVVVIDNSAGSLEASDPFQNPPEPGGQRAWLAQTLADSRARGIPAVVVGSRELQRRFSPALNVATDADQTAAEIAAGGASAYVYERPEENRALSVPGGSGNPIPAFGTGTLGYRSETSGVQGGQNRADALFGGAGFLLVDVDARARNSQTNRAPVSVRLEPVIEDVSLVPVDGTLLRRSRPSLFQGIGRRPRAGDRWGRVGSDGSPSPAGSDPYTTVPPDPCTVSGCGSRINPDYDFTSSNPSIGDFVKQDPNSRNLRKPLQDRSGRVISDASSGLFCAFNPGTTTVSVRVGALAYSQVVTVLPGTVQQPCGTRPTAPSAAKAQTITSRAAPPPAPAPAPAAAPPADISPPPPPPGPSSLPVSGSPPGQSPAASVKPPPPFVPPIPEVLVLPPLIVPPAFVSFGQPIPPAGSPGRVYQVEKEKEEEVATEESQAFSSYSPDEHGIPPGYIVGGMILLALAGASIRGSGRRSDRRIEAATASLADLPHRRRRRS
ncbi:MAG: hypothetical protein H0T15_01695, partial [Thermoleophilaceae bacterium]|nr:hypothetical protein [Thermoleophilaceae bacterium]